MKKTIEDIADNINEICYTVKCLISDNEDFQSDLDDLKTQVNAIQQKLKKLEKDTNENKN